MTLFALTRVTAGDRLALLDDLRPDVLIVLFSNDVVFDDRPKRAPTAIRGQFAARDT